MIEQVRVVRLDDLDALVLASLCLFSQLLLASIWLWQSLLTPDMQVRVSVAIVDTSDLPQVESVIVLR